MLVCFFSLTFFSSSFIQFEVDTLRTMKEKLENEKIHLMKENEKLKTELSMGWEQKMVEAEQHHKRMKWRNEELKY